MEKCGSSITVNLEHSILNWSNHAIDKIDAVEQISVLNNSSQGPFVDQAKAQLGVAEHPY